VDWRIVRFPSISSTQTLLKEWASQGAREGVVILAERQDRGRGRRGKGWFSPPGGLACSFLLNIPASRIIPTPEIQGEGATKGHDLDSALQRADVPTSHPPTRSPSLPTSSSQQVYLYTISSITLLIGCAIARAVKDVLGVETRLKWPNDLQYEGRKLGGILCELVPYSRRAQGSSSDGVGGQAPLHHLSVVVGVGMNVNIPSSSFPANLQGTAVSLSDITGSNQPVQTLLGSLLEGVSERYPQYLQYISGPVPSGISVISLSHERAGKSRDDAIFIPPRDQGQGLEEEVGLASLQKQGQGLKEEVGLTSHQEQSQGSAEEPAFFPPFLQEWCTWSSTIGRMVRWTKGEVSNEGLVLGLSPKGSLIVRNGRGGEEEIIGGEIEVMDR